MARPTDYTPELASLICGRIAEGESLRAVCRDPDMPNTATVMRWLGRTDGEFEGFSEQYAKAMEARADGMFDELLEIADEKCTTVRADKHNTKADEDGNTEVVFDSTAVARNRLRVDARKWALAKMSPRKYGDAVNLKHSGDKDNPIVVKRAEDMTDDELAAIISAGSGSTTSGTS